MCTLSWYPDASGYHVFFNRDEQRSRAPGIPPAVRDCDGTPFIAPFDEESGGTWIAATARGVTICVLNKYDAIHPAARAGTRSRGTLVTAATCLDAVDQLDQWIEQFPLELFHPFTLAGIDRRGATLVAWDGRDTTVDRIRAAGFLASSSSVRPDEIVGLRRAVFEGLEALSPDALAATHHSHTPHRGPESICMHRDDATTVSFSHVHVTDAAVTLRYRDGAPCNGRELPPVRLERPSVSSLG